MGNPHRNGTDRRMFQCPWKPANPMCLLEEYGDDKAARHLLAALVLSAVVRFRRAGPLLIFSFQKVAPQGGCQFGITPVIADRRRLAVRRLFFRLFRRHLITESRPVPDRPSCVKSGDATSPRRLAPSECLWHKAAGCRRSSGVEHTLGKGGVACSIHAGGTILFPLV